MAFIIAFVSRTRRPAFLFHHQSYSSCSVARRAKTRRLTVIPLGSMLHGAAHWPIRRSGSQGSDKPDHHIRALGTRWHAATTEVLLSHRFIFLRTIQRSTIRSHRHKRSTKHLLRRSSANIGEGILNQWKMVLTLSPDTETPSTACMPGRVSLFQKASITQHFAR